MKKFWLVSLTGCFLSLAQPSNAGIIDGKFLNPTDLSKYVDFSSSSDFDYVGALTINKQLCSGTLIQDQWVLTAAHCVYNNKYKGKSVGKFYLKEGLIEANIINAITHKSWKDVINSDQGEDARYDIALIKLDQNLRKFPSLLPRLATTLPTSPFVGSFAGYGKTGDGNRGITYSANKDLLLAGKNIVQKTGATLTYDLDRRELNSYSPYTADPLTDLDGLDLVDLEYMPTSGDSGSPIFLGNQLVGVHSRSQGSTRCKFILGFAYCSTNRRGFYGTKGFAVPVANYIGWISNVLKANPSSPSLTPKIGSGTKLAFTAGGLAPQVTLDIADIEIDDSEFGFEFDLTEDNFSDVFNQSVYDDVFGSDNPTPPPQESVPEPNAIVGLLALGIFSFSSILKSTAKLDF